MKKIKLITVVALLGMFSFAACDDSDFPTYQRIEGTYIGTISTGLNKSSVINEGDAIADDEYSQWRGTF